VEFALEGALGLYSIFGKEFFLGISPDLSVILGAKNISSMHTEPQVGPVIRYDLPSLTVVVLIFVELNLM
jgi:hypothetical protein